MPSQNKHAGLPNRFLTSRQYQRQNLICPPEESQKLQKQLLYRQKQSEYDNVNILVEVRPTQDLHKYRTVGCSVLTYWSKTNRTNLLKLHRLDVRYCLIFSPITHFRKLI